MKSIILNKTRLVNTVKSVLPASKNSTVQNGNFTNTMTGTMIVITLRSINVMIAVKSLRMLVSYVSTRNTSILRVPKFSKLASVKYVARL